MNTCLNTVFIAVIKFAFVKLTIDLNAAELQYIADHLTPEECRTLVAAAHFKSYESPNSLDQAKRKLSKEEPCINLLHHWNSVEGKGETHEALEHRLRQMEKYELANWLGKTVFSKLVDDTNRSLEIGLENFVTKSTIDIIQVEPTLAPLIEEEDPTEWTTIDSIFLAFIVGLVLVITMLCIRICYAAFNGWRTRRKERKLKLQTSSAYNLLDKDTSESESDEKFDVRNYKEGLDTS